MSRIGRRVRAAVNPVSTAVTRLRPTVRHLLTGRGPTARQRRQIRRQATLSGRMPSAEQMMARRAAVDQLLSQDDHDR